MPSQHWGLAASQHNDQPHRLTQLNTASVLYAPWRIGQRLERPLKKVLMNNEFGVDVPGHTLLSRLGRGGMAAVYLAREERLGRLVAIKVIDERFERDERFRSRFEREARTAASLTHPNIVAVYQYGFTTDLRPYLTMAFLEDGSLRDRLFKHGALSVLEALSITRQIAAALQAAHARNIIHRDLKPDNVLFQQDMAVLTDFGIAKVLGAGTALTAAGANPGTVRYFSPEQARERTLDHRSDIYSLGVMLYEMLTGQVPIAGDTVVHLMMHIAQYPPKPLPVALQGLQPLMDLLIAKQPADRLRSCADVISIIQAMERNWTRFGQTEQPSHGVSLRQADTALPERHTLSAAPTQLFVTSTPGTNTDTDARPPLLHPQPQRLGRIPRVFMTLASALTAIAIYAALTAMNAKPDASDPAAAEQEIAEQETAEQEISASLTRSATATATHDVASISRARSSDTARSSSMSGQYAALNVQVRPLGATVTLLDTDTPYQPGMQLPVGSVRIQIAKPDHVTLQRTLLIGPGANNIAVTLDPRGHKRVTRNP